MRAYLSVTEFGLKHKVGIILAQEDVIYSRMAFISKATSKSCAYISGAMKALSYMEHNIWNDKNNHTSLEFVSKDKIFNSKGMQRVISLNSYIQKFSNRISFLDNQTSKEKMFILADNEIKFLYNKER